MPFTFGQSFLQAFQGAQDRKTQQERIQAEIDFRKQTAKDANDRFQQQFQYQKEQAALLRGDQQKQNLFTNTRVIQGDYITDAPEEYKKAHKGLTGAQIDALYKNANFDPNSTIDDKTYYLKDNLNAFYKNKGLSFQEQQLAATLENAKFLKEKYKAEKGYRDYQFLLSGLKQNPDGTIQELPFKSFEALPSETKGFSFIDGLPKFGRGYAGKTFTIREDIIKSNLLAKAAIESNIDTLDSLNLNDPNDRLQAQSEYQKISKLLGNDFKGNSLIGVSQEKLKILQRIAKQLDQRERVNYLRTLTRQ